MGDVEIYFPGYKKPYIIDVENAKDFFNNSWSFKGCLSTKSLDLALDSIKSGVSFQRYIMKAQEGEIVDHINHNRFDNRKNNLRICSVLQNNWNKRKTITRDTTSIFKGVHKEKDMNRQNKPWRASIRVYGKLKCLGRFKTEIEAARAYNQAALKYFGEFAYTTNI